MLFIICHHIYLTSPQSSLPSGYMFSILFSSQWIQLLSFQAKLIQELLFQAAGKSQHLQTHFQQCPQTQSTSSKSVIKLSKWLAFTIINIVSSYYHQIIIIFALCLIVNCPLGHGKVWIWRSAWAHNRSSAKRRLCKGLKVGPRGSGQQIGIKTGSTVTNKYNIWNKTKIQNKLASSKLR